MINDDNESRLAFMCMPKYLLICQPVGGKHLVDGQRKFRVT